MLRLAPPTVQVERRNGNIYLRSPQKLAPYARCVTEWLVQWSDKAPERTFLAERKGEGWRKLSYRETYGAVRRIAQALLDLGAMHVGIPAAPISPAYSLLSKDFGQLKLIFELRQPGVVLAAGAAKFKPALDAVGAKSASVAEMLEVNPGSTQEREHAKVRPETVAKILFTSGSTGLPKGVINTHGMLCADQQQLAQVWQFLEDRPPAVVMLCAGGSTETPPLATSVHFPMERPGVIGLPVPECELKLVPSGGKLEVRVRGPNVMPGYYKRPDLTKAAFDEERFYRIGDAVKFADSNDPVKGIVFDAPVAHDFKLPPPTSAPPRP